VILYGTNPIAWSNDDDRTLGAHIPLEQCLREASQIGFDGIEKGHKMPSDAEALAAVLAPYGLRFVSGWYSLSLLKHDADAEKAAIAPHLDLLKTMGCEVCILAETSNAIHGNPNVPMHARPTMTESQWPRFSARLDAVAAHTATEGLIPVYHHHMGTVIQTDDEVERLLASSSDELKLLFDTGHAFMAGVDVAAFASRHMERVRHLHCKNVRAPVMRKAFSDNWSFLRAVRAGVFTVPGDAGGAVDFDPVLRAAAQCAYDGWLVIEAEQDPEVSDPMNYQAMGLAAIRAIAQAVGLDRGSGA